MPERTIGLPYDPEVEFFIDELRASGVRDPNGKHCQLDLIHVVCRVRDSHTMVRLLRGYTTWFVRGDNTPEMAERMAKANLRAAIHDRHSTIGLWWRLKWWLYAGIGWQSWKHRIVYC